MRILYCASEANPFCGSGGLADVAGSLPHTLCRKGQDCRIVVPLYGTIPQDLKNQMNFITNFTVPVAWRHQYCGLFWARWNDCTYYFIDNEYYFKRGTLYGHYDDAERFAFFSRAILEMLPYIDFHPDIIHANDWQTALVPVYYYLFYSHRPWYYNIKSLFTIHNIQYQGKFGLDSLADVFDLMPSDHEIVEYGGCINLMKGAIICADKVTTVSPTYAKEILSPKFSHGLDPILKMFEGKLSGILNGIDKDYYSPSKNKELPASFHVNKMAGKAVCKEALQKSVGLPADPDKPVVAMITRLVDSKGLDLLTLAADDLLQENVQLILLGKGDFYYEDYFWHLAERYPDNCRVLLRFDQTLAKQIYAGADIFLMPSRTEPCGLAQMICSRYGTVPVIHETGGLYDSIKDAGCEGGGNGFTFASYSAWDMLCALRNALNCYADKAAWKKLVRRVMLTDFSWDISAGKYADLYRSL